MEHESTDSLTPTQSWSWMAVLAGLCFFPLLIFLLTQLPAWYRGLDPVTRGDVTAGLICLGLISLIILGTWRIDPKAAGQVRT